MKNKVNCILLVDDDEATNFLHTDIIEDLEMASQIKVALNGRQALDYIEGKGKYKNLSEQERPKPDIIFLDINMPIMNGYEFLEKYSNLPSHLRQGIVVMFLSTSNAESDIQKVGANNLVSDFISKPLSEEKLLNVIELFLEANALAS